MRMDPMYAAGGFAHHISTECPSWKETPLIRRREGDGGNLVCTKCIRLLQRDKG